MLNWRNKNRKKNKLKENIQFLENLSRELEGKIVELKKKYGKITENKEKLKSWVQKSFTKIRSILNEREDELLLNIDKNFDNIFLMRI